MKHLLHLPSIITLLRDLRGCKRDDLTAVMDATVEHSCAKFAPQGRRMWTTPQDCPVCKRFPEHAAQVADLTPPTAADWDLPPMRRHGDIEKALAELDAVASVGDIKWEASA